MKIKYLALAALLLGFSLVNGQHQDEEKLSAEREKAWESLHESPGNYDWRKAEYENVLRREQNETKSTKTTRSKSVATPSSFAGGAVQGAWFQKAPSNITARVRYADIDYTNSKVYAVSGGEYGGTIWKGDINGKNWSVLNENASIKELNFIRVIPDNTGQNLIVSNFNNWNSWDTYNWDNTQAMLKYSANAGSTWTIGKIFPIHWTIIKTVVADDSYKTVYILAADKSTGQMELHRSRDKGHTFTLLRKIYNTTAIDASRYMCASIYGNFKGDFNIYVVARDSSFVFNSTGLVSASKNNLPVSVYTNLDYRFRAAYTGYQSTTVKKLYYYVNEHVYYSTDGKTFTDKGKISGTDIDHDNQPICDIYSFQCDLVNPDRIYAGTQHLIYSSDNGATWVRARSDADYGFPATAPHADSYGLSFVINPANSTQTQLYCTDGGIYVSYDQTANFSQYSIGLNNIEAYYTVTRQDDPNILVIGSQDQGMMYTTYDDGNVIPATQPWPGGDEVYAATGDGGKSLWYTAYADYSLTYVYDTKNCKNATTIQGYQIPSNNIFDFWNPIMADPTNASRVYITTGNEGSDPISRIVRMKVDQNAITVDKTFATDFQATYGEKITAISYSPANSSRFYVGLLSGRNFRSEDAGDTWTECQALPWYFNPRTILPSKINANKVFVGGQGYGNPAVFVSTNAGLTYDSLVTGLPKCIVHKMVFNEDESLLFAATSAGPYVLVTSTNTWYSLDDAKAPNMEYWNLEYISSLKTVRYSTYGRGIWDFRLQQSTLAPFVSLSSPINKTVYTKNQAITLQATTDGTPDKVEFYINGTKVGEDATAPYSLSYTPTVSKLTVYANSVQAGLTNYKSTSVTLVASDWQEPYFGTAATIPGIIEAENYDYGLEGIAFHDIDAGNNGGQARSEDVDIEMTQDATGRYNVGWIEAGEWMEYTVNVATAGKYSIQVRSASPASGNTVHVEMDGVNVSGAITLPLSDWQSWATVTVPNINLTKGQKVMRLVMDAGGFNLNNVTFVLTNAFPTTQITSPANNTTYLTVPASITINATGTDTDGTISKMEFFNGTTKLGEDLTSPFSYTWTNVAAGSYSITAKATDNAGGIGALSSVIKVKVGNTLPTASISSPANNTTYATAPASITINANASDADGTVQKVEFFQGTTKIGEDLTSPYSFTWSNVAVGTYNLTVKATDNANAVGNASSAIKVIVGNSLPTASISSPTNNTVYSSAPASISINATAADADGTVQKVEFFQGTTKLGEDLTSPFSYLWTGVASGSYSLTVKATDNLGSVGNASAAITVKVNYSPTVSITSPANNMSYSSIPASIVFTATAADQDGTISKVEFYDGATLLGTSASTASPYSYTWTTVTNGTHTITAKAYDNLSAKTSSASITLTVGATGCSAQQWSSGNTSYAVGTVVKNTVNGTVHKYQCTVAGWCQSTSSLYYEPGNGMSWTDCWTDLGVCSSKMAANGSTVSVTESAALKVYPNPVSSSVMIQGFSEDGYAKLMVINSLGEVVLTREVNKSGDFFYELDMEDLPNGLYTIKVDYGASTQARTILKD